MPDSPRGTPCQRLTAGRGAEHGDLGLHTPTGLQETSLYHCSAHLPSTMASIIKHETVRASPSWDACQRLTACGAQSMVTWVSKTNWHHLAGMLWRDMRQLAMRLDNKQRLGLCWVGPTPTPRLVLPIPGTRTCTHGVDHVLLAWLICVLGAWTMSSAWDPAGCVAWGSAAKVLQSIAPARRAPVPWRRHGWSMVWAPGHQALLGTWSQAVLPAHTAAHQFCTHGIRHLLSKDDPWAPLPVRAWQGCSRACIDNGSAL